MLFTTLAYLGFFVLVFVFYYLLPHKFRWILLLLASYVYYAFEQPLYGLLLLVFTTLHYFTAIKIEQAESKSGKKLFLGIGIGISLAILFFFKYYNFFASNVVGLVDLLGMSKAGVSSLSDTVVLNVVLPIGISFYTFQTLSYTLDVYYGKVKTQRHFGKFALFVSFFPQLVIGPVERTADLMPQLSARVKFDYGLVVSGLRLILWGFFKKLAIADRLGEQLQPIYDNVGNYDSAVLWLAYLLFPIQLYADFSGYTDIARGCSRMLGIQLSKNFFAPLFARSVTEFWRSWNVTISTWFRDYVFYPIYLRLKHNRKVKTLSVTAQHNLSFVGSITIMFLLLGIWHGANWQFVILGLLQAVFIITETYIKVFPGKGSSLYRLVYPLQVAKTYLLFGLTALFFRAVDVQSAWVQLSHMFVGTDGNGIADTFNLAGPVAIITVGNILLMVIVEAFYSKVPQHWLSNGSLSPVRWLAYIIILVLLGFTGVFHRSFEFIYMHF